MLAEAGESHRCAVGFCRAAPASRAQSRLTMQPLHSAAHLKSADCGWSRVYQKI